MAAITISSQTLSNWNGSANVGMFVIVNGTFTSSTGDVNVQADINQIQKAVVAGAFYKNVTCNVAGNVITIPSFTLDSTVDSPNNPNATYSAYLWDLNTNRQIQVYGAGFGLPSNPTTTSWANIFNQ